MNRMLQQALALLLLCGMLFSLAACGSPAPAETSSSAPAAATEKPSGSWWKPASRQETKSSPSDEPPAVTAQPTVFLTLSINEVMLSNKATLADGQGLFPDWVELYNYGSDTLSLGSLMLCREEDRWVLPDRQLEPGGYLVVFCDGSSSDELHASFTLAKEGVDLSLETAEGALVEEFQVPACGADQSVYRNDEGAAVTTDYPTPGFDNTMEGYAKLQEARTCSSPLQIYEVLVYNAWELPQNGQYYDLVELKNMSGSDLELSDYYLSDKGGDRAIYQLPERTLEPGEIAVIYCTGEEALSGGNRAPFGLSAERDQLYLSYKDGALVDYVSLHDIPYHGSYGRMDGSDGFFFFSAPTAGYVNAGGCRLIAEKPVLLGRDGVFDGVDGVTVELSAPGEIYYTLDGSAPTTSSAHYTEPLRLTETGVVRAIQVEQGKLTSEILELAFIINEGHTLPVVSLVGDPDDITGPAGLYRNPSKDIERIGAVKFFEDGQSFSIACGIKLHGATSKLAQSKKSFKLKFLSRLDGELHYDLFGNGVTDFSAILLRAAQESTYSTLMRDNLVHQLAIRAFPELPAQDYKYAVLYINGEYWGVYNIREAHTVEHYAYHYGYDPDTVTQWKELWDRESEIGQICAFALNHNLADDENYQKVVEHINIDSVIGWTILQAWSSNHDCNPPNMRFYYSTEDEMLRYALVDLDLGMFEYDGFDVPLRGSQVDGTRYSYAFNKLALKLLENKQYQRRMAEQLAAALKGPMATENVLALIDELADQLRPEIQRDRDRWAKGGEGDSVDFWEHGGEMVDSLRKYVERRGTSVIINSFIYNVGLMRGSLSKAELQEYFKDIED